MRTHALLVRNEHPAALSVFQSVCAMFVVGNEAMLREMLAHVPILIAAGAPERDLVEILSADKQDRRRVGPARRRPSPTSWRVGPCIGGGA